jgi:hypothetical protein
MKKILFLLLFCQPILAQNTTQDATRMHPFFYNAMSMIPSPAHKFIYEEMENCTDRTGQFEKILWFSSTFIMRGPDHPQTLIDNQQMDVMFERQIYGLYWNSTTSHGDSIQIIMLDRRYWFNPTLISHEVLHSLFDGEIPLDIQEKCLIR